MDTDDLIAAYAGKSDDELRDVVVKSDLLTRAIVASHPQMAQDAGFELFDQGWAKRYWRSVMAQISGIGAMDRVYSWAVGVSIAEVAKLILQHYTLPAVTMSAAVALAVMLVRAAKASREDATSP